MMSETYIRYNIFLIQAVLILSLISLIPGVCVFLFKNIFIKAKVLECNNEGSIIEINGNKKSGRVKIKDFYPVDTEISVFSFLNGAYCKVANRNDILSFTYGILLGIIPLCTFLWVAETGGILNYRIGFNCCYFSWLLFLDAGATYNQIINFTGRNARKLEVEYVLSEVIENNTKLFSPIFTYIEDDGIKQLDGLKYKNINIYDFKNKKNIVFYNEEIKDFMVEKDVNKIKNKVLGYTLGAIILFIFMLVF